ncbi:MAG TPA: hypothetical protein VG940_02260 [Gemmatimonadales bacterium]|nr:hypothetical protein [Gemmatimonadales bacterium]
MRQLRAALILSILPAISSAQSPDLPALAERFTRMTAVTGFERAALDSVQALLPGARRDRAGNVIVERGSDPATLIACPFDEVGYVVGGIRDDGWLTLRRVGARAPNALWDQSHEGQRVTVWGRQRALPAVVGVRSTHLTRGRAQTEAPFTVDDAVVDIGASNAAEVRAAGVDVLAPVAREKKVTRYGSGLLAGPSAGRRSACAALVAAWLGAPRVEGRVVVAFLVEQELSLRGLRGLRTIAGREGPFASTILVDGAPGDLGVRRAWVDTAFTRRFPTLGTVSRAALATRYPASAVETVALDDLVLLRDQLAAQIGGGR